MVNNKTERLLWMLGLVYSKKITLIQSPFCLHLKGEGYMEGGLKTICFNRAERHDLKSRFCYSFSFFFSPLFLGEKRKGDKNNQSRNFKWCLSARSFVLHWISFSGFELFVSHSANDIIAILKSVVLFEKQKTFYKYASSH